MNTPTPTPVRPLARTIAAAATALTAVAAVLSVAPPTHAAPPTAHAATKAATPHTLTAAQKRAQRVNKQRQKVVQVARAKKRTARYVYGAAGPNAFDCSGFVMWVYKRAIGYNLPHYSGAQMKATSRVARKHLKPGDLLFYGPGGSQHVALYIGNGKQIGANNPRVGVVIESINSTYWRTRYAGAGRIIR